MIRQLKIGTLGVFLHFFGFAQQPNWQNKDLKKDSVFGISTEKAYQELLKDKIAKTVLVAVIDGGIDTSHEDLKDVMWTNPKEIAGNKEDDDHNGYIDDMHGWNFIGGNKENVNYDNLELTRLIRNQQPFFDSLSNSVVPDTYRTGYQAYRKMKNDFDRQLNQAQGMVDRLDHLRLMIGALVRRTGKLNPAKQDFENLPNLSDEENQVRILILADMEKTPDFEKLNVQIAEAYNHFKELSAYALNPDFDPRPIVGDDYMDQKQKVYGNSDVTGPDAHHGTHVAGIISAVRDNNVGIQGVADHVAIMSIRVVPNGDERDKDVANAIRYAADNGARIINMSFGKPYSWNKKIVDEAVKYALTKDVLFVHAAGNDGMDMEQTGNSFFPNRDYADGSGQAGAWIQVGASGYKDDSNLVASFSNYGQTKVDVFAPGVHIYSCIPGSKYEYYDGTSMAAPVVTGLAALIREYYPKLTAIQVKEIILKSVMRVDHDVRIKDQMIPFSKVCLAGGIVNAYSALKLAATYN